MPFEHSPAAAHASSERRCGDMPRILLLDNYDSYTYNLFQLLARISGADPLVVRNDELTAAELEAMEIDAIVISPGPGHPSRPRDFGICEHALELPVPLLGVCLGHQGLATKHGGQAVPAAEPVHGRKSPILHAGEGLFEGIPQGFEAVRYHSIVVSQPPPDCLEVIASTPEGIIMALRHRERPQWGVQFHPESIGTEHGDRLLANFLGLARQARRPMRAPTTDSQPPTPSIRRRAPPPSRPPLLHHRRLSRWIPPEDAFVHLHGGDAHAFWLDSARTGDRWSRYSYIGAPTQPGDRTIRYCASSSELTIDRDGQRSVLEEPLLPWLERQLSLRAEHAPTLPFPLCGGFVGWFGYGLLGAPDGRARVPSPEPDAALMSCRSTLAFDHRERSVYAVIEEEDPALARRSLDEQCARLEDLPPAPPVGSEGATGPVEFRLTRSRARYLDDIEECLRRIRQGETYEVCLTNQLVGPPVSRPLDAYRILRARNPAPFGAYLRMGELAVLSCSPELFLRVDPRGEVVTKPIKGTLRRGASPAEDERLRQQLASSEKDRAENLMIVDLLRNDLGRVCEIGSVEVPELMTVESFATVHQLVSTVRGRLRPEHGAVACLQAAFPGGSMTGAPKLRTMEILDELEPRPRGVYSGCLGYLSADGAAQLAMTIRTAVVSPQQTSIGVGGAIVALSCPQDELDEVLLKGQAMMSGIAAAKTGDPSDAVVVDEP